MHRTIVIAFSTLDGVVEDPDGTFLAARFTHEDIAHMVGATRQWVTISLKRLSEQGVLRLKPLGIVIADAKALAAIRDGETGKTS